MTKLVKITALLIFLTLWITASGPVLAQNPPAPSPPPAGTPPATAPTVAVAPAPTLPPVTFTASEAPTGKGLENSEKSGPVDLLLMQDRLAGVVTDPTETPISQKIGALCKELMNSPFRTDPVWRFGLNPLIWLPRTAGTTADWWKALRALPPKGRPVFEGFPYVYDDTPIPASATPGYRRAVERNNLALDTLFVKGDVAQAAEIIETAVSADPTYALASYNAGVLHIARQNVRGSLLMFLRCRDRNPSADVKARMDDLLKATAKMGVMLKKDDGQARRLIAESIDTSWALAQAGQFGLARRVAGQGVVVDPDEKWPECPAIIAYCYARQGDLKSAVNWLISSLERAQRPGVHERIRLTLVDVQAELQKQPPAAAPAAPAPAPAQPPAAPAQPPATNTPPPAGTAPH